MPKTIAEWAAGALLRWRLNSRIRTTRKAAPAATPAPIERTKTVTIPFLDGYKTYIIAVAMLLAGLSQLVGVELPSFDGQSAGHLVMEGFAILFLRKGLKAKS